MMIYSCYSYIFIL